MEQGKERGLSSEEAYSKLRIAIACEIEKYKQPWSLLQFLHDVFDALHDNPNTPVNWFGVTMMFLSGCTLLCGYQIGDKSLSHSPLFESIFIIIATVIVLVFMTREQILRRSEVVHKVEKVLAYLNDAKQWSAQAYPALDEPASNAVKMVWTYRDNILVNVPWSLLVEGDVIVLGASHTAPAYVQKLSSSSRMQVSLDAGEVYNPPCASTKDGIEEGSEPGQCQPHPRENFVVIETPIQRFLRGAFQKRDKRPQSVLHSDMKKICHYLRTKLFWGMLIVAFFTNYIRWRIIPSYVGHYTEVLLIAPIYAVLPIIPISFPILWMLTIIYGTARIRALFTMSVEDIISDEGDDDFSTKLEHIPCQKVIQEFVEIVRGNPESLSRTANLLLALGSASTFCCADKEGILCFPNPVPEKVFIFRNSTTINNMVDDTDEGITFLAKDTSVLSNEGEINDILKVEEKDNLLEEHQPEVLDLSFDPADPFGVCFDDGNWKLYTDSLKPLGINALLNSPCSSPFKNSQIEDFTGHISLGANSSPLPNVRRCLCLLAQTVGFDKSVLDSFIRLAQVTTFRPVYAMEISNVKSNFFLSIIREKQVPSMISVLTADKLSGDVQLFTQGSAEIVLDACSDFWDGEEICEISLEERKKALDFYHRTNIMGHCIAFSYRPVFELSTDLIGRNLFLQYPSTIPISPTEDFSEVGSNWSLNNSAEEWKFQLPQDKMTDGMDCTPVDLTHTVSNCNDLQPIARLLQKQIFVGMVTLQDLVKDDIASLVEELDRGGIRFVHFSYENELRSRVFAERLGLETGWNCHISLADNHGHSPYNKESTVSEASETEPLLRNDSNATLEYRTGSKSRSGDGEDDEEQAEGDDEEQAEGDDTNYGNFFFISNRAKLPRGIKNIRPHLEKVDDVPLLVPLFTDCTPHTIREMINIMQEYGETVCCIGSSLNVNNADIFSQADVSIAIDPLHPQRCLLGKTDNFRCGSPPVRMRYSKPEIERILKEPNYTPLNLAADLTGIPCSLTCHRNDKIKFVHLICEARRVMVGLRDAFHFLLSCCLSLSALMILSFCMLLPLPLSGCQLLWLLVVVLPMLSLSLIGTPAEREVMQRMPGKKIMDVKENIRQFLIQFCPTFLLNACFCATVFYPWILYSVCEHSTKSGGKCRYVTGLRNTTELWNGYGKSLQGAVIVGQEINLFFLIIYFITLSTSYVHRTKPVWKRSPFLNKPWTITVLVCVALQILYMTIALIIRGHQLKGQHISLSHVHYGVYIVGFLWPFLILGASEMIKKRFIRIYKRYQRRERLKFDTKLGMNSPV